MKESKEEKLNNFNRRENVHANFMRSTTNQQCSVGAINKWQNNYFVLKG